MDDKMPSMDSLAVYAAIPALLWSSSMYVIQSIGILMLYVDALRLVSSALACIV